MVDSLAIRASALIGAMTLALACGAGLDPVDARCREVRCESPPEPDCIDGIERSYQAPGSCQLETGLCSYETQDSPCAYGCLDTSRCRQPGDVLFSVEVGASPLQLVLTDGPFMAADTEGRVYLLRQGAGMTPMPSIVIIDPDGALRVLAEVESAAGGATSSLVLRQGLPMLAMEGAEADRCDVRSYDLMGEESWTGQVASCRHAGMLAVAHDGRVYLGAISIDDGKVQPWDAEGAQQPPMVLKPAEIWPSAVAPLLGAAGRLYAVVGSTLFALDASGAQRWALPGVAESLQEVGSKLALLAGDALYLPMVRELRAVDVEDGSLRWRHTLDSAEATMRTAPVVDGQGRVYIGVHDPDGGYLLALQPDGSLASTIALGEITPTLVNLDARGGVVVAGDSSGAAATLGRVQAFDSAGQRLWQADVPGGINDLLIDPLGRVHVHLRDGAVWTLQGEAPLLDEGWPRRRGGITNGGVGPQR